ncbi:MAG: 2-C-methyl-D-erythritol 2,4-cyclodiphosphate synthase [Nitrospinae bacterium]|nr:2-C-methyl-D-erythritol 2,4-cyclodiphosphate synthase [Nitrospinota bacterium]
MMRVGIGYDVHPLVDNRRLILGGVEIPYIKGLMGHSDADVLLHAICDAILGALGGGDIGIHFPNTDPGFKDISSMRLLGIVLDILRDKGFNVNNIDSTIVVEAPKLAPYIPKMVENISTLLEIDPSRVNVKATTSEGLGFVGRGEGIVAYAVVTISSYME